MTDILAGIVDRTKAKVADYLDLSAAELAKQINAEYVVILANERTNYPKAMSVGEKLVALRRGAEHGEWQAKLKQYCPAISYETATKYIRLWNNREKIESEATIKSVATTDLTIELALNLIAKPKPDKPKDSSKGKPDSVSKGGVEEAGNEPAPRTIAPDVALEGLENDEVFHTLQSVYENRQDDFLDLVRKLAASLGMTLMPASKLAALEEAAATTQPIGSHTTTQPSVGLRRA
jgi:hypothetical protein